MILAAYLVACAEVVGLFSVSFGLQRGDTCSVDHEPCRRFHVRPRHPSGCHGRPTSLVATTTLCRRDATRATIRACRCSWAGTCLPGRPDCGNATKRLGSIELSPRKGCFLVAVRRSGLISNAYDQRINFNPPDGEIGFAFVLGITWDENLVGLVQFFAALGCAIGVFALARRFGLRRGESAFGGLAFLSLPLVALQSSGAKNDLIVASYLVGATVFLLGESKREITLGSAATALAVGTKFAAAYGVAILLALVLVGEPRSRRAFRIAALACGALAGSYWYVVNAHETGHFLGDQSSVPGLTAPFHPPENLLTAVGTLVDTLDLSGSRGADIFLYALAALCLAVAVTLSRGREPAKRCLPFLVGLSVFPLLLLVLSKHVGRPALVHLYADLGQPKGYLATGDPTATSPTTASDTGSWFGPQVYGSSRCHSPRLFASPSARRYGRRCGCGDWTFCFVRSGGAYADLQPLARTFLRLSDRTLPPLYGGWRSARATPPGPSPRCRSSPWLSRSSTTQKNHQGCDYSIAALRRALCGR